MAPRQRIAVVMAVVAWVALVSAGPASATTGTLPASCSDSGHILNSWAYVSEVGPHHQWHQFQYEIHGDWTRGQSNVRRTVLALLVVVVAVVLPAPAAPAGAIGAVCTSQGHTLEAYAYFSDVGPHHHWDYFEYILGGHSTAGKSNVKFWLYETSSSNVVYWNHSPDNLVNDLWYGVAPPWDVYTWAANPEFVRFHAWFDERWVPDPHCPALTPTV